MLYEFRKHNNATNATNAIYPGASDTRTCQRWIKKFKNGDFNLFDGIKSGRPVCFHFKITFILRKGSRKFVNNDGDCTID